MDNPIHELRVQVADTVNHVKEAVDTIAALRDGVKAIASAAADLHASLETIHAKYHPTGTV